MHMRKQKIEACSPQSACYTQTSLCHARNFDVVERHCFLLCSSLLGLLTLKYLLFQSCDDL